MNNKKGMATLGMILFWVGILVVIVSHLAILKSGLPMSAHTYHAYLNLFAAFLIIGSKFIP